MVCLARRIEHLLNMTVQGAHDADAREHRREAFSATRIGASMCRLPFWRVVFGLRKLGDVGRRRLSAWGAFSSSEFLAPSNVLTLGREATCLLEQ
jgi:hypothetical protein